MRRKLYIRNEWGQQIALNGESGITMIDATGFGAETAETFADIGSGFFTPVNTASHPQQSVAGTLIFKGEDTFAMYQSFADFLLRARRLYVAAELVRGRGLFLKEVRVNFLTKGERALTYLEVPVSFLSLTPWYREVELNIRLERAPTDAVRFGTTRFGQGRFTAAFDRGFAAEIPPAGHQGAVLTLRFTGAVRNPVIELRGTETGTLYCRCAVSTILGTLDRLEYSSSPMGAHIRRVNGDGTIVDLMDRVDPAADPFAPIPVYEACTLTLDGDEEPDGSAEAAIRYYYRSV